MTSAPAEQLPNPPNGAGASPANASWALHAVALARLLAAEHFARGDLAQLRRMDPDQPDAAVFWRLLAQRDLFRGADLEAKWALILHGIALMTPTNSGEGRPRSAHDGSTPVGRALFQAGDSQRATAFYSETRLNRLLTARGPMLRILLARMFRMLAGATASFDWSEMAGFILSDGYDDEAAEQSRRRIARAYYQAERRNSPTTEE